MLTDSGVNAMSDNQVAAMLRADDAYAGSQSFIRLQKAVEDVLGKKYLLPAHQGRACENIVSKAFIKPGNVVPMNYHFTTTLAHVQEMGARVAELYYDRAMELKSDYPFKGNMNIEKLEELIQAEGAVIKYTVEEMKNSEGEIIERAPHAMMKVIMQVPFNVAKGTVIRRRKPEVK